VIFAALADDADLIPTQLAKDQRDRLLKFVEARKKPQSFVPQDATIVGTPPANLQLDNRPAEQPIKQYMIQILPHRPVPGMEDPTTVDVYYFRPNPERGKPGITIKHTVDTATGNQVGATEVLVNRHSPLAREEVAEAVELARGKSPAVRELYKDREKAAVQWEFLQMRINRKHEPHDVGDRVLALTFRARAVANETPALPVRVTVNLTKGVVVADAP
jgi:hypothetical protein